MATVNCGTANDRRSTDTVAESSNTPSAAYSTRTTDGFSTDTRTLPRGAPAVGASSTAEPAAATGS